MNRTAIGGWAVVTFVLMLATTLWASFQQNLFTEFNWSGSPMWFQATIVDFYLNQIILWIWVVALEPKHWVKFVWLIIFVCFGSMGTALYILKRLFFKQSLLKEDRT